MRCKIINESDEYDLIRHWIMDIGTQSIAYREPILDQDWVQLILHACKLLEQNTHVFVLAVDIVEDYIQTKNEQEALIEDPLLATVVAVFMAHKCDGAPECLKIQHVIDLLCHYTEQQYKHNEVTSVEGDILMTLGGKLPVSSTVDDLWIFVEKYIRDGLIMANIQPLCLKILELLYIEKMVWFDELKYVYNTNPDCLLVFQNLLSSKVFIPVCVLVIALKVSDYHKMLDVRKVIYGISKITGIHDDHIDVFCALIVKMIK